MKTREALQRFVEAVSFSNLLESDRSARALQRAAASGDPGAQHAHERTLIRAGRMLEAAKIHLHHHGHAYLKAHATKRRESDAWSEAAKNGVAHVPDEVDKRYDAADDDFKAKHKAYRRAVHDFREKHGLEQPEPAYYRMRGDHSRLSADSHIGEDSLAGKALPSHKEADMHPEHHAHAVATAVYDESDQPQNGFISGEHSHHAEEAVAHHHPNHKQEWEVIEHNPDGSPNYVAFKGLGAEKKHPDEKTRRITQFKQGLPIHPDD